MELQRLVETLHQENESKILLVLADGLGGLQRDVDGGTELEVAATPNLDDLARRGTIGLADPVAPGITCGSGAGHLALFGYDPITHLVGRGVLSALGIDFDLKPGDVAARGNFCTLDGQGYITDRRAGRLTSEKGAVLVKKLATIKVPGAEVHVEPVKEHRFLLVLRGEGLGGSLRDTDPQETDMAPLESEAEDSASEKTASAVRQFVDQARKMLCDSGSPANGVLLRGFGQHPKLATVGQCYGLEACALAGYPMYRGLARLLGMTVIPSEANLERQIALVREHWCDHDFFFVHYKATDSTGEDGDFDAKVAAIETLDRHMPAFEALKPDVLTVTGDHSTPSRLRSHSWHPVPVLLTADTCRRDNAVTFGETACLTGGLGRFPLSALMPLMLAHAGRLRKYGA